ncbi:hypothetical protein ACFYT4_25295 [Streptomyces sp. NPDC004609]|uniref:DUF7848 domain-containing protein n=1 Tax=Streptomyces sp. NPDC004609 TaxID=3364704 RepID=UPI00368CB027
MRTTRLFRHLVWTLTHVESEGVRAHIECVSGTPPCGAEPEPDDTGQGLTVGDGEAWAEYHFRRTGHRRYARTVCDTVQWDPPAETDPRTLPGVTT